MVIKKLHFPIFILFVLSVQSCNNFSQNEHQINDENYYSNIIKTAEKFNQKENLDSAFYYFNKAKISCDSDNDNEKIIYSLIRMANIQQIHGDFSGSEASATEALDYFDETVDPNYRTAIYNILGIAFEEQLDYDRAIYYYKQTLKFTIDRLQLAIIKNNIAVVYIDKKEYNKAIQILSPLQQINVVLLHPETQARILDNLGYCYFKFENPKSIILLQQSMLLRKKTEDNFGVIASYYHLSDYYQYKDFNLAKQYALMAYQIATKIKSADDRLESLALIIKNTSSYDSKKYSLIHIQLNDSINNVKQTSKNQFAKIKYDSKKVKTENLKLKSQKEKLLIVFVIFLIVVVFTFLLVRSKNKRQQQISAYEAETKIAKKLHDELANTIFHSMTFAETQDLQIPEKREVLIEELDKIYHQVRNISKENSSIDVGEKFFENLIEMLSDFNSNNVKVIINNNFIDWKNIHREKKIAVYRILLEMMVNMKKHSQCSLAIIGFETIGNNIKITYSDNGIGDNNQSFITKGLQNVENRIQAINGTIKFETNITSGFKIKISFPK